MAAVKKSGDALDKEVTEERKYPLKTLEINCLKLFGITSSTFLGATSGLMPGDYTITEIKTKIAAWMKREVR